MKFYLFLFVFLGYCIIFGQAISREDSAKIDKEIESKKWLDEISRYRKEQCSKDSLKAVDDSKIINKYFIGIAAPYGSDFPADKELEASLKKLGIIWGGTWMGNCLTTYSSNSIGDRFTQSQTLPNAMDYDLAGKSNRTRSTQPTLTTDQSFTVAFAGSLNKFNE